MDRQPPRVQINTKNRSHTVTTEVAIPKGVIRAPYRFTGKIVKVTIDVKEMKKADNAEENWLRPQTALKKALAD